MDTFVVTCVTERRSPQQVTHLPHVGYFTSPGIDTKQEGPTAFSTSSKRHRQSGVNEIAQIYNIAVPQQPSLVAAILIIIIIKVFK